MNNNLTFTIERVFGPENALKGFFVSKSNAAPSANPMVDMFKTIASVMGETDGEGYKTKAPQPEKIFCSTEKEIQDFITYQLGEFTNEK